MGLKKKRATEARNKVANKSKEPYGVAGHPKTNGKDTLLSISIQFFGGRKEWEVMKTARSRGTWEGKKFQRVGRGGKKKTTEKASPLIWKTGKMLITIS